MDILVADDERSGRFLLNSTLIELGHSVTETANGCDAWEAWKRVHHQLVISDWIMPGIDGLEGLTEKQEASVRQILESGRRLLTLIDHILGFSQSRANELSFETSGAPRTGNT